MVHSKQCVINPVPDYIGIDTLSTGKPVILFQSQSTGNSQHAWAFGMGQQVLLMNRFMYTRTDGNYTVTAVTIRTAAQLQNLILNL
jgi:hypothetical protein